MTRAISKRRRLPKYKRTSRAATKLTLESLADRLLLTMSATFVKQDKTMQGNWVGTDGFQGYDGIGNATSLPSYATVTPTRHLIRPAEKKDCLRFDPFEVNEQRLSTPVQPRISRV
jgi:hypothetical protein